MPTWEAIVKENVRVVYRISFRILGNEHDAEDVSQDVFYEATKLFESDSVTDWPGMLRRMATLRAIDRLRRQKPTESMQDSCVTRTEPFHAAQRNELAESLRSAVAQLPEQQAAVFTMAHFECLTRAEISEALGISMPAVSTAMYKARQSLKSILTNVETIDV